jgi:trigger factor
MAREDMRNRGMKVDGMPIPPDLFKDQAERRVRLGLILAELVRANNLQAHADQVKAQIDDFAQSYEDPAEVLRWYYADRSRLGEVEALVLEENVVKYVVAQAVVTETSVQFDELMGNNQA